MIELQAALVELTGGELGTTDTEKPAKATPSSSGKSWEKILRPTVPKFRMGQDSDDGEEDAEEDADDYFAEAVGKAASMLHSRSRGEKKEKTRFEEPAARASGSSGRNWGNSSCSAADNRLLTTSCKRHEGQRKGGPA